MNYTIETGIPIPSKSGGKQKSELRILLERLEVGQSVKIETPKDKKLHIQRIPGRRFVVRKVDDDYIRIWRVESEEE